MRYCRPYLQLYCRSRCEKEEKMKEEGEKEGLVPFLVIFDKFYTVIKRKRKKIHWRRRSKKGDEGWCEFFRLEPGQLVNYF